MKSIIVAYDQNHAIGYQNHIPWEGMLPADMAHFKQLTVGKAVIMGQTTFKSIGGPLPDRLNIVLSHEKNQHIGVSFVSSLQEAYAISDQFENVFVIGGAQIYQLALDTVERIYATEIKTAMNNADVYFPALDPKIWQMTERQDHEADDENMFAYSFVMYQRY